MRKKLRFFSSFPWLSSHQFPPRVTTNAPAMGPRARHRGTPAATRPGSPGRASAERGGGDGATSRRPTPTPTLSSIPSSSCPRPRSRSSALSPSSIAPEHRRLASVPRRHASVCGLETPRRAREGVRRLGESGESEKRAASLVGLIQSIIKLFFLLPLSLSSLLHLLALFFCSLLAGDGRDDAAGPREGACNPRSRARGVSD